MWKDLIPFFHQNTLIGEYDRSYYQYVLDDFYIDISMKKL